MLEKRYDTQAWGLNFGGFIAGELENNIAILIEEKVIIEADQLMALDHVKECVVLLLKRRQLSFEGLVFSLESLIVFEQFRRLREDVVQLGLEGGRCIGHDSGLYRDF